VILTNGCSFTEGYSLPPSQRPWPSHLADSLQDDLLNISLGGASNKRIFRTTVEKILTSNPSTIVIGWTFHNRTEITHAEGCYCRYTNYDVLPDFVNHEFDTSEFANIHKFWTTYIHNEFLNYRDFVYNVLILQEILEKRKIKYKFFMALDSNYFFDFLNNTEQAHHFSNIGWHWGKSWNLLPSDTENNFYVDMLKTVERIDLSKWIFPDTNMRTVLSENNFKIDSTGHFYEDAHEYWSNMIMEHL